MPIRPSSPESLTEEAVFTYLDERAFRSCPQPRLGIEVEWLTQRSPAADHDQSVQGGRCDDSASLQLTDLHNAIGTAKPALHGSVSLEPGGQVEISSQPHSNIDAVFDETAQDVTRVRSQLAQHELELLGSGYHPTRAPERILKLPRYEAMEHYFTQSGACSDSLVGPSMMCNTASVQINVDVPSEDHIDNRWRLAHALGPLLTATFANSPLAGGTPTGWKSTRMAVWHGIDPSRTMPVNQGVSPARDWAHYSLDASVMLMRKPDGTYLPPRNNLTFRDWLRSDAGSHTSINADPRAGTHQPSLDDFAYHLTTLFPPVRPRGWLELRMVDMQDGLYWMVAPAIVAALFFSDSAADAVFDIAQAANTSESQQETWQDAAQHGLSLPGFAAASAQCFDIALEALVDHDVSPTLHALVAEYADRYVRRGLTPADEILNQFNNSR